MNLKGRQIIIHIGMPKTGTTSIQKTLKDFRDEKFHYANIRGQSNHSYSLWSLFSQAKNPENHFHHVKRGRTGQEVDLFINEVREDLERTFDVAGDRSIIFSGEGIPTLSKEALVRLRDFLLAYCRTIQIITYVRSPISFIQSSFQQRLKGEKGSLSLVDFYPNYRDRFEKFEQVFGTEVCQYRKFDPQSFRENDVVFDFCDYLGISLESVPVKRVNDSLSLDAIKLLYAFRLYHPADCESMGIALVNARLVNAIKIIGAGKLALGANFREPLLDANQEDIKWMEKRLGQSLSEDVTSSGNQINLESELLNIDPRCVGILKDLIGQKELTDTISGSTPQEVAQLVHILRNKLSGKPIHDGVLVNSSDHVSVQTPTSVNNPAVLQNNIGASALVDALKSKDSKILDGIPDRRAEQIISDALCFISSHINNAEGGLLRVAQLGNFCIREAPAGSFQAKRGAKRIVFRPKNR